MEDMSMFRETRPANVNWDLGKNYNAFEAATTPNKIAKIAKGGNLGKLVDLAEKAEWAAQISNPCKPGTVGKPNFEEKRKIYDQFVIDRVSEIKVKLAQAVDQKKAYYDKTIIGKIKKLFLKISGKWNDGHPASIKKAENFLFTHNIARATSHVGYVFRDPRTDIGNGRIFSKDVDLSNFYNYDQEGGPDLNTPESSSNSQ